MQTIISQYPTLRQYSTQGIILKCTNIIFSALIDSIASFFFAHFMLTEFATLDGKTLSTQLVIGIEQY